MNLHYYWLKKPPNTLKYQVSLVSIYNISSTCFNETDIQYLNLCTQSSWKFCHFYFKPNRLGYTVPKKSTKTMKLVYSGNRFVLKGNYVDWNNNNFCLLDEKKNRFRTTCLFSNRAFFVYLQIKQISYKLKEYKFAFYFPKYFCI